MRARCSFALALLLLVAGCGGVQSSAAPIRLNVYAAASLKDALATARDTYLASLKRVLGSPSISITISTDSSAALRTQIEQGAPADLFLSADTKNPQALVDAGLTDGEAVAFAGNLLTIIVPSDNPGGLTTPADVAKSGLKIIAAGDGVPITKYANQLIENLAELPNYPRGFADAYAANIASREENVKAIVAKIETGEGDVGIVYVTDAAASDAILSIHVPDDANVAATYAGVVIKGSNLTRTAAHGFLAWLAGAGGQRVLADFGFLPPG